MICKFSDVGLRQQWNKQHIRFLIVGGVNTLVGFSVFPLLYLALGVSKLNYMWVLIISQIICTNFSYLTNKNIVFRAAKGSVFEYLKYNVFQIVIMAINFIALPIGVELFHASPILAQTIYTASVVVVSYLWHSKITFVSGQIK